MRSVVRPRRASTDPARAPVVFTVTSVVRCRHSATAFRFRSPRCGSACTSPRSTATGASTPFLLQGFRVADDGEIETLKKECGSVTIDPTHSTPGSFEHLPDIHVKPKRFELALDQAPAGPLRQVRRGVGQASPRNAKQLGLIPQGVLPNIYGEMKPIEAEIKHAEEVYQSTDATLELISKQVSDGEKVNLEKLGGAIENMVESAIANPDALLWVARIRAEDAATYAHGVKVAIYLLQLGRHLGFPPAQLANLGAIGLLLDLGKIKVDRDLLLRKGKLTPCRVRAKVKQHVESGPRRARGLRQRRPGRQGRHPRSTMNGSTAAAIRTASPGR